MSIPAGITVSSPIIGGVVELFSAIFFAEIIWPKINYFMV